CGGSSLNRHNFPIFCLWRGAQMHLARRAVHAVRAVSPSGVCATRSWCLRDAQLVLARRAA
ncbi:hypothetical protein A2U01_0083646, partial [Trifolium medium]|nr:hypothetical protein [Trifolium medium]